jgi:hypothetical protein
VYIGFVRGGMISKGIIGEINNEKKMKKKIKSFVSNFLIINLTTKGGPLGNKTLFIDRYLQCHTIRNVICDELVIWGILGEQNKNRNEKNKRLFPNKKEKK